MGKNIRMKSVTWVIAKILIFYISIFLLQELLFFPLTKISIAYWSEYDGGGLNEPWFLSVSVVLAIIALVISFIFIKFFEKKDWSYIRIYNEKKLKFFFVGNLISLILILLFTILLLIYDDIQLSFNSASLFSAFIYIVLFLVSFFLMAFYEELIFRGYILKTIETNFNLISAIIITSLLFSIAHSLRPNFSIISFSNIFLFGCFLSLICIYYNNLWLVIGIHFSWNFLMWFFNYPLSGAKYPNPVIKLNYVEYSFLSGSKFGPEDSVLLAILTLVIIVFIAQKYKKKLLNK